MCGRYFVIVKTERRLLPLDGRRWLRRDVVANAIDTLDLVDDVVGNLGEEVVRQMSPVGCHGITRCDGTQGYRVLVGALVAHHANAADIAEEDGSCLPNLVLDRHFDLAVLHVGWHTCCKHATCLFSRELDLIFA